MLSYDMAKKLIFAAGKVVDGYNGHWAKVAFAFDPTTGKVLVITKYGYHEQPYFREDVAGVQEALYQLNNHPNCLKNVRLNP